MSEETITKVNLELVKDMIFKWDLGLPKVGECFIDETNHDLDEMIGPDPSRLLASAILGCLSASFVFCLQKRNLKLDDFKAEAEILIERNEKKLLRVKEINVSLNPQTTDPIVLKRINQCKKMFEQYCTITESVRAGIDVNLKFSNKVMVK
jgi:uncharacterized OsmC-like protein